MTPLHDYFYRFPHERLQLARAVPGSDLQTRKRHAHCVADRTQQQFRRIDHQRM